MSNISPWKKDFPIFVPQAHPYLCYLDTAATCLTPKHVAEAMFHYQCYSHANSHKGMYQLSTSATEKVEQARQKVAGFIGAQKEQSIVFNAGATEGINLVAYSFVEPLMIKALSKGECCNIVISAAEHHANLLPWQRLAQQYQVELRIAPLSLDGTIDLARLSVLLDEQTCILAFTHCSNVIGKINEAEKICRLARNKNIPTLIDGAQAVLRGDINVQAIGCDFYVFSAHKIYGPTGCGVLYAKSHLLEQMRPYQLGGGMVNTVDFQQSEYLYGPLKFECGSHNVAGIVGLVEAIDYMNDLSIKDINLYIDDLALYMHKSLGELSFYRPVIDEKLTLKNDEMASLVSFQCEDLQCQDVASLLDSENIALRAGQHCAQPLHKVLRMKATLRVSLGLYNGYADIDKLIAGLIHCHQVMAMESLA
jgi:cysteine desulfurase / selenocysteine lyase